MLSYTHWFGVLYTHRSILLLYTHWFIIHRSMIHTLSILLLYTHCFIIHRSIIITHQSNLLLYTHWFIIHRNTIHTPSILVLYTHWELYTEYYAHHTEYFAIIHTPVLSYSVVSGHRGANSSTFDILPLIACYTLHHNKPRLLHSNPHQTTLATLCTTSNHTCYILIHINPHFMFCTTTNHACYILFHNKPNLLWSAPHQIHTLLHSIHIPHSVAHTWHIPYSILHHKYHVPHTHQTTQTPYTHHNWVL